MTFHMRPMKCHNTSYEMRYFMGSLVRFRVKSCRFFLYLGLKHRHIDKKDETTLVVRLTMQLVSRLFVARLTLYV